MPYNKKSVPYKFTPVAGDWWKLLKNLVLHQLIEPKITLAYDQVQEEAFKKLVNVNYTWDEILLHAKRAR